MFYSVITGSGSYIPTHLQTNGDFSQHLFYTNGQPFSSASADIVRKFKQITGIEERRYVTGELTASDIGTLAAKAALQDSGVSPEEIDQLIVAHNFGNVLAGTIQSVAVPSLASQIKHQLGIRNPACVAYDLLFGCPGWLQGIIHADAFFKAGVAKKALIVGTETLSRVIDSFDRDSMIFSDGAGAVVLEYKDVPPDGPGILSASVQTHALEEVSYIDMGPSHHPDGDPAVRYMKMKGRKVYEYALSHVPAAMKECLDKSGVAITDLKKILIHQANEKMDEAIIQRLYQLYDLPVPENIMPMSIHWLGNSSVATIPTLYDLVKKGQIPPHALAPGDVILFASVGAGMNINAVCYRC
ncbi:MAG: ketoacyl-ACP synthase III [Chitinophagaceae bacterium]|nr:ketoacyl-ACP synthase III [Chitinophagaceae bacterium]MCW5925553.1 ketoacyl-ACP synthase III [Chitinophagaceae bacterium]